MTPLELDDDELLELVEELLVLDELLLELDVLEVELLELDPDGSPPQAARPSISQASNNCFTFYATSKN